MWLRKKKQHNSMDGSFSTLNTSEIFRGSGGLYVCSGSWTTNLEHSTQFYALQTACLFWLDQFSVNRDSSCNAAATADFPHIVSLVVFLFVLQDCAVGALFVVLAVFNLDISVFLLRFAIWCPQVSDGRWPTRNSLLTRWELGEGNDLSQASHAQCRA